MSALLTFQVPTDRTAQIFGNKWSEAAIDRATSVKRQAEREDDGG
jgi:hypothetical protein